MKYIVITNWDGGYTCSYWLIINIINTDHSQVGVNVVFI